MVAFKMGSPKPRIFFFKQLIEFPKRPPGGSDQKRPHPPYLALSQVPMQSIKRIGGIPKPVPGNQSTMPKVHIKSTNMQNITKPQAKQIVYGGRSKNLLNFSPIKDGIIDQFSLLSIERPRILKFEEETKDFPRRANPETGPDRYLPCRAELPFPKGVGHEIKSRPEVHTDIHPLRYSRKVMKIPGPSDLIFRKEDLIGSLPPRLIRGFPDGFPQVIAEALLGGASVFGVILEFSRLR